MKILQLLKSIQKLIQNSGSESAGDLYTGGVGDDRSRMNEDLKPGDVVITTNIGARGTDFVTDDTVNKNGGLFVLGYFHSD